MKVAVRRVGAALLALVAAVVAVVVIAIALFHTRWGRDALTELIEDAVADKFTVPVSLKSARITLGGNIELGGLKIGDALAVDSALAHVDVPLAMRGDIRISGVKVRSAHVDIAALTAALKPPPPGPEEPFRMRIQDLEIADSTVAVADLSIAVRSARGSMAMGDDIAVDVDALDAVATTRGESFAVTGSAAVLGKLLIVTGVKIRVGGSAAAVHLGLLDLETLEATAVAAIDARAADARRIAAAFSPPATPPADPLADLTGDLTLPAVIARVADPIWVGAAGRGAGSELALFAQMSTDLRRARVDLRTAGIDPAAMWRPAPAGQLTLDLRARANLGALDVAAVAQAAAALPEGRGGALTGVEVSVTGKARGRIGQTSVDDAEVTLALARGKLDVDASAASDMFVATRPRARQASPRSRTAPSLGRATAKLDAVIAADGAVRIDRLDVTAHDIDIAQGEIGARVHEVTVNASGPLADVAVTATARASSVRAPDVRVGSAKATGKVRVDVLGLAQGKASYPTAGEFELTAGGVVAAGQSVRKVSAHGTFSDLGRVLDVHVAADGHRTVRSIAASAMIDRRTSATRIQLRRGKLVTADETWTASPAEITLRPDRSIQVSHLALTSRAGTLRADGDTRSALAVDVVGLDLERTAAILRGVAGVDLPMAGKLDVAARLGGGGRDAEIDVDVARFSYAGGPAIDVDAQVKLADGRATAAATVTQPDSGLSVKAEARGRAPRSALDFGAWSALDLRALESATIEVAEVSLAAIEKLTGRPMPVRGKARARIELTSGAESLRITGGVRELAAEGAPSIDVTIDGGWDARGLSLAASVDHEKSRALALEVRTPLPLHRALALRPDDYLAAPLTGKIELASFDLRRLNRAGLVREPLQGTVQMKVDLGGTVGDPTGSVTGGLVRGLQVAGATFGRVTIGGKANLRSVETRIWASQRRGGLLRLNAAYRWADPAHADIEVIASRFDLRFLRALAPEPTHILADTAGTVDARLRLVGPPDAPVGTGMIKLRGGQLLLEGGARRVTGIELDATLARDEFTISRLVARSGAGSITADGKATLVGYLPRRFNLTVATERLPVAAGIFSAEIQARVSMVGRFEKGWIRAQVAVEQARIRLDRKSEELFATGELEDVVYVDKAARKKREEEAAQTEGAPKIEIRVTAGSAVWVTGKEMDLRLYPLFVIRLENGELTSFRGKLRASQKGYVVLFDRRYRIAQIELVFDGKADNPSLDIQLAREFPSGEVRVQVYGTARDPKVSLTSDGGYDQTQVLSIMLGQEPGSDSDASLRDTAVAGVGSVLAREVTQKLPVKLDKVEVNPGGFEVGKYVFERVLAGYRFRSESSAADDNQHEGTVEWNFFRRWVLDARYGDKGVGNADVLYILRW